MTAAGGACLNAARFCPGRMADSGQALNLTRARGVDKYGAATQATLAQLVEQLIRNQ